MISIQEYSVKLGDFRLNDISLNIEDREIFALIGRTGSGKSVLLESMAGFYDIYSGSVLYDGVSVTGIPLEDRRIGYVYQDYCLFPHLKVIDNVTFGLKMHKMPKRQRREKAMEMMRTLGIDHLAERKPYTLSGGEQQRCALARALVLEPDILFLDEPFSALDPNTRKDMYRLIRRIHEHFECTIVFVTHDFQEAAELADRVGIIMHGCLKEVCPADQLFCEHEDEEVNAFLHGSGTSPESPLGNSFTTLSFVNDHIPSKHSRCRPSTAAAPAAVVPKKMTGLSSSM